MRENVANKMGYWESFDDIDGLMHNCRCLLEDREGNVWIGTTNGLCKYDGREFINFTHKHGLAACNIRCLYQDKDGNIWFGTLENGVKCYDGSGFLSYTDEDGLISNYIRSICQDGEGNIWFGTQNGLSRYDGKDFSSFTRADGMLSNNVRCLCQDRDGNTWIAARRGVIKYDGEKFVNFTQEDGLISGGLESIGEDCNGNIWIGTQSGLSRYDGERFVSFTQENGLAGNNIRCLCQDRDGNIWIGTIGGGISHYNGEKFINFSVEHGLACNNVYDIMQDREGSIWAACHLGGISRYDPNGVSYISGESVVEVMIKDTDGNLWWGNRDVLSQYDSAGDLCHYHIKHPIYELAEDSKGQLWVGTYEGGIFRFNSTKNIKDQKPENFAVKDGLAHESVIKIYEDEQNNIWFGTRDGLSRYDGEKFTNFTTDDGLGSRLISAIYRDNDGVLWLAGWEGKGITSYDGKNFHRYTKDDGLICDNVSCIKQDDNNNLWIGTHAGLCCYNGKSFRSYTTADGLLGDHVRGILQDSKGQMWFSTVGGGVSRFDGRNFQVLTMEDGLPSNCVTGMIEEPDGSMIISTYRGICRYTPDYGIPPMIRIDELDAGEIYKEPKEVQIPESVSSVRIKYHGISSKTKWIRYSYILEGYDRDWRATWEEEVRYDNLPIGEYTFKVIAINRDLVYSEKAAEMSLKVVTDPRDLVISELSEQVKEQTQELRSSEERLKILFEYAPDAYYLSDLEGNFVDGNKTAEKITGYKRDELMGRNFLELKLFSSEQMLKVIEILAENALGRATGPDEFVLNRKNGSQVMVEVKTFPVEISQKTMVMFIAHDITNRKRAEATLQQQFEIEKRIVKELEEKTAELSRSNEELNTFIFASAHDLKAHVVSIQGFSSILMTDHKSCFDKDSELYIERIHKNSESMGTLIDDLLGLARIGRIEEPEELTSISELISEVVDQLSSQLKKRGTRLVMKNAMPTMRCNSVGIIQIFNNLISNANKFMGADNKSPTIEIGYRSKDDYHEFYIKDNGIGISKKYHERVFHIFQRLSDLETEGTGLGLTIVKKRVERFGGKVWIDSEEGKGTTVYFTIPKTRQ